MNVHYLNTICKQCGIRTVDSSGILFVSILYLASSDHSLISRRIGGVPLFARSNGKCRNRRHSARATWCGVRYGCRLEAARRNRPVDIWCPR